MVILLLCLIIIFQVGATEVDSFSLRYQKLEDSRWQLNKSVNNSIDDAVKKSNRDYQCNEKILYRYMKRKFNLFGWSKFEIEVVLDSEIPKHHAPSVSIFEYFPFCGVKLPLTVAPLVKVGDVLVGADKFSHFFNEGWNYFKISELNKKGVKAALMAGERDERGFWGVMTTGVYSYADLVANYQGLRFWRNLVRGEFPIVKCVNENWKVVRKFDWLEYLDQGFDEGYNCSSFRSVAMEEAFKKRVLQLEKETGREMSCPISIKKCSGLTKKYGAYASMLLHPLCNQDNKYPLARSEYVYRRIY